MLSRKGQLGVTITITTIVIVALVLLLLIATVGFAGIYILLDYPIIFVLLLAVLGLFFLMRLLKK